MIALPSKRIQVVARADKSGTTEIFTKALSSFSDEWRQRYGVFKAGLGSNGSHEVWNETVVKWYGMRNRGVSGLILSFEYSMGYLSVGDATEARLSYAKLENSAGKIVTAGVENTQSSMDARLDDFGDTLSVDLVDAPGEKSYPIVAYTYILVYQTSTTACDSVKELYRYIQWFSSDAEAHEWSVRIGFAPLSENVARLIQTRVLDEMTCKGELVSTMVEADIQAERLKKQTWRIPVIVTGSISGVILLAAISYVIWQQYSINRALFNGDWRISSENVRILGTAVTSLDLDKFAQDSASSPNFAAGFASSSVKDKASENPYFMGRFNKKDHLFHKIMPSSVFLKFSTKRTLLLYRDQIIHTNVTKFYGVMEVADFVWTAMELCTKGRLRDVLRSNRYNLDDNFKYSMSCDIAEGMIYLHDKRIIHGNLSTMTCWIDSRWNVKISEWTQTKISMLQKDHSLQVLQGVENTENDEMAKTLADLWKAPELLADRSSLPIKESDVYSFALILVEIFSREEPFKPCLDHRLPSAVLKLVREEGLRPDFSDSFPRAIRQMTEFCWDTIPANRPPFPKILKRLHDAKPTKKGILDCMMESLDEYVVHLEKRTKELDRALEDMASLLHKMLPPSVAAKLSVGESVPPEFYDSVTIFFSDIVGFTTLSATSSPLEIIDFLNDLYTTFDAIVDGHEVYKVHVITCKCACFCLP